MKWFKAQGYLISPMPKMVRCGICGTGGAKAGVEINQRRRDRGMLPRPVRAVVIGFPNVGKSALINRLLASGGECCPSWCDAAVALDTHLRSAGATGRPCHPAKDNQTDALKLAICDDIGGAYITNE